MKTLTFWRKKDVEKELKENLHEKRFIFNFLNSHDLYQIQKQPLFVESLSTKENTNLIDGFIISLFLTLKEIKNVQRFTGPKFTEFFLKNKNFNVNKKHFFRFFGEVGIKTLHLRIPPFRWFLKLWWGRCR